MVLQLGDQLVAVGLEGGLLPAALLLKVPDQGLLAELADERALVDWVDRTALQLLESFWLASVEVAEVGLFFLLSEGGVVGLDLFGAVVADGFELVDIEDGCGPDGLSVDD